jgi:gluconate 2-dehydrogenase gamma chain
MVADPARFRNPFGALAGLIHTHRGAEPRGDGAVKNNDTSRRNFLRASGGALGAAWLGVQWSGLAVAAGHAHEAAAGTINHEFKVLTPEQARDVEAIASQIVPSGATPGAREAGVVYFIDHVNAGIYARNCPEFLAGLTAFQQEFATGHPGPGQFADLDAAAQLAYLKSVEKTPFFGAMRFLTVAGLLALPSYGGNEDKLGWKMVGFVDRHVWSPPFGYYDQDYPGFVPYPKGARS